MIYAIITYVQQYNMMHTSCKMLASIYSACLSTAYYNITRCAIELLVEYYVRHCARSSTCDLATRYDTMRCDTILYDGDPTYASSSYASSYLVVDYAM